MSTSLGTCETLILELATLLLCAGTHHLPTMLSSEQILEDVARDGLIDMYEASRVGPRRGYG